MTGSALIPGVIAAIRTFGGRINFYPHLLFPVTEGGMDEEGVFHRVGFFDDARVAELLAREVLRPEWAVRLLSWRHTGFSVHSLVRATTKTESERVGKHMIRPLLSLERLLFLDREGKVGYRHAKDAAWMETMD